MPYSPVEYIYFSPRIDRLQQGLDSRQVFLLYRLLTKRGHSQTVRPYFEGVIVEVELGLLAPHIMDGLF